MSDVSLLAKDQVLAQLNADNPGHGFTFDNVTFGEPVAATGTSPTRDTQLTITGVPNKGFKNTVTIQYNRIDLAAFGITAPIIQIQGVPTLQTILDGFNLFYGANLQLTDIRSDLVAPADVTGGVLFTMIAAAGSYAYRGQIDLTLQPADVDLATVVTTTDLSGLTYPSV